MDFTHFQIGDVNFTQNGSFRVEKRWTFTKVFCTNVAEAPVGAKGLLSKVPAPDVWFNEYRLKFSVHPTIYFAKSSL